MLGWMHYLGRGTVRDQLKGVKTIRDSRSDLFPLGESECLAFSDNTFSDSSVACRFFELCQLGSERDWLCKHLMAVCVFFGFGTSRDQKKAVGIFERLASNGNCINQVWLGRCYYWGLGVSIDHAAAIQWYTLAANQGDPYGQWELGRCYYWGRTIANDFVKAAETFRKSAEQGNRYAQWYLGRCYETGEGVSKDIGIALDWYRKAADQDLLWAIHSVKELQSKPRSICPTQ
ncbi:uncharacterized protein BJ171DRAFT_502810 [Polychytrium aggregatum]|uniref:uncharacterized protein n=1 Tax=Polychytrium aggregatum TaxID=110093 RepID=UPI0022FF1448|nr:uncharacterized protein BJ171DRAFT_502810 [Polychytrium aggregatum]KAI9205045.1 hypothetical protein BJ171DRAFT_502810 [Polychytrium aggregatum]